MKKRGQVWYTDFIIGVLIFSIMVVSYFYYAEHQSPGEQNTQNFLISEVKSISNMLVTTGYPTDWTANNVSTVGLTDGNQRINTGKLAAFNSWSYSERKSNLYTIKEYYFYLEHINGTKFNELCKDAPGCTEWNTSNYLVQNTRLVILDSEIVKMKIYTYEQP